VNRSLPLVAAPLHRSFALARYERRSQTLTAFAGSAAPDCRPPGSLRSPVQGGLNCQFGSSEWQWWEVAEGWGWVNGSKDTMRGTLGCL